MAAPPDLERAVTLLTKAMKRLVEVASAQANAPACREEPKSPTEAKTSIRIERYKKTRFFAVIDYDGTLIVVTVYRKGAEEVRRRLMEKANECRPPPAG